MGGGTSSNRQPVPLEIGDWYLTYLLSTEGTGLIYFENRPGGEVKGIIPRVTEVNHTALQNDTVFVSSNGNGIFILNKELDPLKNLTTADGLLHNSVFSVVPHGDERWVNYMNGISQWTTEGELLNYTILNGFPLSEINVGAYAGIPSSASPILVGGKGAWVSFNPRNVYKNPYKPSIFLSGITVNNSPITEMKPYAGFNYRSPAPIRLKHDQTTLNFEFAGLSYIMPKNNSFRYQLDDFDSDWNYSPLSGRAGYSKIPPGKYLFRAQASNNDGIWSDELTFPITVLPPWWQTWQAVILYILFSLAVILFVRRNTLRKAELKHHIQVKELEKQQMEQMHHLKVKYFTDISHEIRTPLMLILHPIEEIIEESSLLEEERSKMRDIQNQGRNLLRLVNQLLEINSVELKEEVIQEEPIVLKSFIENIRHSFQSVAIKKGIDWTTDLSEVAHRAYMLDRDKMEKVLLNLLSNAFKHTPKGGTVSLSIKDVPEGDRTATLQLEVEDSGAGIIKEDLPRIFERFYKSGENRVTAGSGIGLSLVKAIVENLMGGSVSAQSEVGKGSLFTVRIPRVAIVAEESPKTITEQATPGYITPSYTTPVEVQSLLEEKEEKPLFNEGKRVRTKRTVLLVEDNISLLNSLSKKLSRSYNVFGFVSAEQAADFLHREEVDIVVSDIMLPGKSGKEFCAEIKSNLITSHIPVILLTAIQQEDIKMKSLELGADDYLTKPFSYKELELRIQNILKRQEQLHDLYKRDALPEKEEHRMNKFDTQLVDRVNARIEANLSNGKYSVEELSSDVSLSRVHLYRKMKNMLGVSPSRYMRDYRLKKAAEILSREDIRINDLADTVGFEDAHYFVKCFKEKYGVSPNRYAKM
ncbi:MAG: response regulator [Bacteroidales bacterium]|nr:response regulator [Bacteroidales bacterium]